MIGVFAGPSLFGVDRTPYNHLHFYRPAKAGDIIRLMEQGCTTIALIDGVFEAEPSVWHKEILYALAQNINIYGSASLGALRAAECEPFGMIGVGQIFEQYRDQVRVADADVAVLHAPHELGCQPLTVALVDVAFLLEHLLRLKLIEPEQSHAVLKAAHEIYFKDRSWEAVFAHTDIKKSELEPIKKLIAHYRFSQKTRDAVLLLDILSGRANAPISGPKLEPKELNKTIFLQKLLDETIGPTDERTAFQFVP